MTERRARKSVYRNDPLKWDLAKAIMAGFAANPEFAQADHRIRANTAWIWAGSFIRAAKELGEIE